MKMRILTLEQRAREIGRIRLGEQKEKTREDGSTVRYPARLETFRFTSPSREAIDAVAAEYGGEVRDWGDGAFEVITKAKRLPVAIPGGFDPVSQAYELWDAGGCKRRCDGEHEWISDGNCLCDREALVRGDEGVCKPHLRVALLLPDIPIVGVWRLETSGYYANTELPAMISMLQVVPRHVRGTLRLEKRKVVRDGKSKTFPVPVIDVALSMGVIVDGETPVADLPKPTKPELPPGPDPRPLPLKTDEEPPVPPEPEPVDLDTPVDRSSPVAIEPEPEGDDPLERGRVVAEAPPLDIPDLPSSGEPEDGLATEDERKAMNELAMRSDATREEYVAILQYVRTDGKATTLGIRRTEVAEVTRLLGLGRRVGTEGDAA